MNTTMRVLVLALAVAGLSACRKDVKEDPVANDPGPSRDTPVDTTTRPAGDDFSLPLSDPNAPACLRQRVVSFDFDQAVIRPEFQELVSCHAKYLTFHPDARLTLEGHADERGTREYNLGLGERRGNAVSDLLKANGGKDGQLSVTSYGEERPTCTDTSEDCWARNRRVELVYTAEG